MRHKNLRGHVIGDAAQGELHKCHKCDFRSNAVIMKDHVRSVHGGEMRRHKCHLCEYSSTRKENLTRHQKQHSKGGDVMIPNFLDPVLDPGPKLESAPLVDLISIESL